MANKPFGIEELNIVGSGTPTISSPGDLDIVANLVNISNDLTAVGDITAAYFYGDGSNLTGISGGSGINAAGTAGAIQFKASGGGLGGDVEVFGIDFTNQRIGIGTDPTDTNNFYTATSLEVPLVVKAKDTDGSAGSSSAIQFIQSDGEENSSRFIFVNNDLTRASEIYSTHNTITAADSQNNLTLTVYGSSTESLTFRSGATSKAFYPSNDDTIDLGISGSNEFKNIYFSGSLYQNGTEFTAGGIGAGDISVTLANYTCDSPITVTENAGTADIGIGTTSNAHGRKFVSAQAPDPNIAYCDGDLWYQPETVSGDALQVIQGAWNGITYANTNPITVSGAIIGIGTTSNAHGRRYIESGAPTAGIGTYGDIWYDIAAGQSGALSIHTTLLTTAASGQTHQFQSNLAYAKVYMLGGGGGGGGATSAGGAGECRSSIIEYKDHQDDVSFTGGYYIEFDGIPEDASEITVSFGGLSSNGNDHWEVQLGTSSTFITANYDSMSWNARGIKDITSSNGFVVHNLNGHSTGGNTMRGSMTITKWRTGLNTSSYSQSGVFKRYTETGANPPTEDGSSSCLTAGDLQSAGIVTRLRVKTGWNGNSTQQFDAGYVGVSYRTSSSLAGGTGGAGALAYRIYTAEEAGSEATYTIGGGGTNGTSGSANGGNGVNSVFDPSGTGATLTAGGGTGGTGGGTGGTGTNGAQGTSTNSYVTFDGTGFGANNGLGGSGCTAIDSNNLTGTQGKDGALYIEEYYYA